MPRVTDHTRTEKIGGDSIVFVFFVVLQVVAGNRYDRNLIMNVKKHEKYQFIHTQKHDTDQYFFAHD